MKKLILMAAGALPLMFVACTNELENVAVEDQQQAPQEIVGAQLVSKGMTINVNRGTDVDSRLDNNGNFVDGDKVGLAWYKANGASTIYDVQLDPLTHNWGTYMGIAPSDNKIFGNHKFTKNGGDFSTDANVYEGFHFAYYPYAYEKKVDKKIVTPNANPQKGTSAEELYNEAFYISAQDSLLATSANEDGTISKTFNLARVVWGLHFDLTPGKDILAMEYLKDFQIRNVQIQTGGNAWDAEFFNPTAQIIPGNLPYALYDTETGEYKGKETEAQLYNMNLYGEYSTENDNNLAFAFTEKAGMMTTVVENPAIQLNAYNEVRMLLFPTDSYATLIPAEELAVEVHVDCGKFRFYCEDEESNNGKQLKKLREFLSIGINDGTGPKASVLQNANVGFDFDLTGADFIPDFSSITNIIEWENAVKLVKDLKLSNPKFTVDGNVEFANSIPMPENGIEVETTGAGQLNVVGNVILPEDLLMDAADKFVVSEGAVLTVADDVKLTANVINKGTIKAGKKSLISKVDNTLGRIEVVYGSYVEVETGKEGTIAYEVLKSGETPKRINTMINGGDNGKYAHVNTLVINKGVTFDLMMSTTSSSEEDPYYEVTSETNKVTNLKDINIEMNGGTIKANVGTGKTVNNIYVFDGTNKTLNINVEKGLYVKKGKVTIDADAVNGIKSSVSVPTIEVANATLIANVTINTINISNPKGATTTVNDPYTIWYSGDYTQGGTASGNILKSSSGASTGNTQYATLQEAFDASVTNGGVVELEPGVYNDEIELPNNAEITLQSTSGNPADVVFTGRLYKKNLADSKVVVKNITITAANSTTKPSASENYAVGTAIYSHYDNTDYEIDGCIVSLPENSRLFKSWHKTGGKVTIKNCIITNCTVSPIQINDKGNYIIENNTFSGSAEAAVVVSGDGGNLIFKDNTVSMSYDILLHKNWSTKNWIITTDGTSNAYHTGVDWASITANNKALWTEVTPL